MPESVINEANQALLTVITLSDSVLNSSAFCQIRYLGPVLIWIGTGTECAARTMWRRVLWRCMSSRSIRIAVLTLHDVSGNTGLEGCYKRLWLE